MAFRGLFVDAKISNPKTGNVIDLNLMGEKTIPYLQGIEINLTRNVSMNMSINLAPKYDDAIKLISKDNEWIRVGNTLGVRWGYSDTDGAFSDWHYGFMGMPEVDFGEEISISIPATSLAWNTARIARSRDWCSDSPKSFGEIATAIAAKYGMEVEYGVLNEKAQQMKDWPKQSYVQGGRTDLQFLTLEAEKLGIRLIILNNKFIFVDSAAPLPNEPQINATFQMYGKIDISKNIYPMNGFSPENMGSLFLQNIQGMAASPHGPNSDPELTGESLVSTDENMETPAFTSENTLSVPPKEDGQPPKGMEDIKTKTTVTSNVEEDQAGRLFCLPINGEETEGYLDGIVSAARESDENEHGISVSFTPTIALPNILPGMYVRLEGVGDYFTGTYMLNEIDFNIGDGGAEMECRAFCRGFPGVNEAVDPFAATVKYKPPVDGSMDDLLYSKEVKSEG